MLTDASLSHFEKLDRLVLELAFLLFLDLLDFIERRLLILDFFCKLFTKSLLDVLILKDDSRA